MTESSTCLRHDACPACPSSDACAVYDDGHAHCFSCGSHFPRYEDPQVEQKVIHRPEDFLQIQAVDLPKRHITASVCRSHGYGIASRNGRNVQVAEYCDATGNVVAQKIRTEAKEFFIEGDAKKMKLWPEWRWKPGGKRLLITEGEIDCLSWQTLGGDRWPAVSVPNGAAGAAKAIKKSIEFVESFEHVILCFDNDEAGRTATEEVCQILSPGKVSIMRLPDGSKDICEAIQQGKGELLVNAFWGAVPFRPDGIVGSDKILEALLQPLKTGHPYPWAGLTKKLHGARTGELVTLTAGTGIGKSTVAAAIGHHWIRSGLRIGYISLEESLTRTAERLVGLELRKPLHLSREGADEKILRDTWHNVFAGRVCVFNHFGSMDAQTLLSRVKFMRQAEGVDFVVIDHLSILVSGWDSADGDERRLIDNVMTSLRSICEQTGVGMLLISHLRSTDSRSKSHEEGAMPRLADLRGSKSIAQLSDAAIAVVRDQTSEEDANLSTLVVLKNRFSGETGVACHLRYDIATGTLQETEVAEAVEYGF